MNGLKCLRCKKKMVDVEEMLFGGALVNYNMCPHCPTRFGRTGQWWEMRARDGKWSSRKYKCRG